jgi:hypothetical protein
MPFSYKIIEIKLRQISKLLLNPMRHYMLKLISKICQPITQLSLLVLLLTSMAQVNAQVMKGQWIGSFTSADDVTRAKTDYIMEIESTGSTLSGHSYTYFSIAGKRYFVICRLEGKFDKGSKSLIVSEMETIKTNTPPDFKNCLQTHQLTYFKQKDKELLLGKWKPWVAGSDCGKGETELERKLISKLPPEKKSISSSPKNNQPKKANTIAKKDNSVISSITDQKRTPIKISDTDASISKKTDQSEQKNKTNEISIDSKPNIQDEISNSRKISNREREKLTERTHQFIKTIDVSGPSFRVEIYDNGQVDGDTVTIFLNDKLLVPAKKLTTSPITLDIKIDNDEDVYDLVMYAENMGTIPPNTALMIVTTSTNRYEVNITSTEQTSGAVRFRVKR